MAQVTVVFGGNTVSTHHITHHPFIVGRDAAAEISIDNVGVSRNHCQFTWDGKRFYIEDMGSSNGTYHRGQKIRKAPLGDGDSIQVGKHTLIFKRPANELGPPAKGEAPQPGSAGAGGGGKSTERDLMSDNMMTFKMDARLIHQQMGSERAGAGPQRASELAQSFVPAGSTRRRSGGGFGAFLWRAIKGLVILSLFAGAVGYLLWSLGVIKF